MYISILDREQVSCDSKRPEPLPSLLSYLPLPVPLLPSSAPLLLPFSLFSPPLSLQVHVIAAGATAKGGGEPWTALLHPHHHEAEQGWMRAGQHRRQQGERGRTGGRG